MKVLVDLCVVPIGQGVSVAKEVIACERIIRESGLKSQLHAYGTNIEGDWDEVFAVVKRCHQELHEEGVVRISSTLRVGTRSDKAQGLKDKVDRVERGLK
jgi:uncharacterized protein (TIGR00106 family)